VKIEGHKGAHGPDYHEAVLKRLQGAVKDKTPYSQEYKDALLGGLRALKQDVGRPGSPLNNIVTGKKP
jgi:hypothetical protein